MFDDAQEVVWLSEYMTPSDRILHGIRRILVDERTEFQELQIVESRAFGKALLLDGTWQSCTADEFIYHEALVQPALVHHGAPRTVLILGGGEGATAREVLRWHGVERVVMVDIDPDVVRACERHLPEMHRGAFDDPRLDLRIGDALGYLERANERFDVVISDLSDPIEEGPSFRFFTREYFEQVRSVVADDGVFVVQAGSVSPVDLSIHARLHHTVRSVFRSAATFRAFVPSFGSPWGFVLGSNRPLETAIDPEAVDAKLAQSVRGPLQMLTGETLRAGLAIPPYLARAIAEQDRPYTLADPPRFGQA